jgi:predicted nucleic acid-binding protein
MTLLVDTSVWSLAFRRDGQPSAPEVSALRADLQGADQVLITGLGLQEVLQGFSGPKNQDQLVERLSVLAFLQPNKQDHITAADFAILAAAEVSRSAPLLPCSSNCASAIN